MSGFGIAFHLMLQYCWKFYDRISKSIDHLMSSGSRLPWILTVSQNTLIAKEELFARQSWNSWAYSECCPPTEAIQQGF